MTADMLDLARRAVACRGWRWLPGTADCWGGRVREGDGLDRAAAFPDLRDPATLGCLLALVREAWGDPTIVTAGTRARGWIVDWDEQSPVLVLGVYATEVEALVVALEAAP